MNGLDVKRLVKITSTVETPDGERYLHGTGYFVTDDLVLTANHVLSEGKPQKIKIFVEAESSEWKDAQLQPVWRDTELDALLLKVDQPLKNVAPVNFLEAHPAEDVKWESVGYPIAATQPTDEGTEWKGIPLKGDLSAKGGGGQGSRVLALTVDAPPEGDGWQGISGAPVFVGDNLAGIIKSHLPAFKAARLDAVPVAQLHRSRGFLTTITPQWLTPFPNKTWCLTLVSETQKERCDDIQLQVSSAIKRKITGPKLLDVDEDPKVINITEALENRARWLQFIQAICAAPVMIIDVTGFEPAVMLMLGIRAVVRRGVTITTISTKLDVNHLSKLPFNIQEAKLISLAEPDTYEPDSLQHPIDKLGQAILDGLIQLKDYPGYLDLPAYDAVRCPEPKAGAISNPDAKPSVDRNDGKSGSGQAAAVRGQDARGQEKTDIQTVQDTVLMLCPFRPGYEKKRKYVYGRFLTVAAKYPIRMLDMTSPRLVGQALYEHIRWSRCCIVDWTDWRANVFFEFGVRLACSSIGPICLMEKSEFDDIEKTEEPAKGAQGSKDDQEKNVPLKQKGQLVALLDPIKYIYKDGSYAPFKEAWRRYDSFVKKGKDSIPFPVLEHEETYRTIAFISYDWTQEPITRPPHEELVLSVETQLGINPQSTGNFQALFSSHREFGIELQRNAAERGIAAWYYFLNRYREEIDSKDELKEQLIVLGEKVLQWIPMWPEYQKIRTQIDDTIADLYGSSK